jgi:hypothetical protein
MNRTQSGPSDKPLSARGETVAAELEALRSRRSKLEERLIELQQTASRSEEEQIEYQWLEKEQVEIESVIARLCKHT